jgi:RimJ/RimL family protein N-acetyltransferase
MEEPIQIVSERLILRPIQLEDSELIYSYRSNSAINQYQGWIPKTLGDVHDFITKHTSPEINLPGSWFQLVIIKKDDLELIGDLGIHFLDLSGFQVELGITLSEKHQGNGFATEALTGAISFLFNHLKKHRIIASIDPRNLKSIQLFERLNFRKEAHFKQSILIKDEWVDDLIYAMLKDEWCSNPCQDLNPCQG